MKINQRKSELTQGRKGIEMYQRQIVFRVERDKMDINEAVQKYHISNKATLVEWIRKYGIFDIDYIVDQKMIPSKDKSEVKKLKELLKAKDEEISRLKKDLHLNKQREIMVSAIMEVVKEDYNIDLSKKAIPGLLKNTSSKEEPEE
jgi:hypothetical protein